MFFPKSAKIVVLTGSARFVKANKSFADVDGVKHVVVAPSKRACLGCHGRVFRYADGTQWLFWCTATPKPFCSTKVVHSWVLSSNFTGCLGPIGSASCWMCSSQASRGPCPLGQGSVGFLETDGGQMVTPYGVRQAERFAPVALAVTGDSVLFDVHLKHKQLAQVSDWGDAALFANGATPKPRPPRVSINRPTLRPCAQAGCCRKGSVARNFTSPNGASKELHRTPSKVPKTSLRGVS